MYKKLKTDVSLWVTQLTVIVLTPPTDHQLLHLIHINNSSFRPCADCHCTVSDRKFLVCFNLLLTAVWLMNNNSIKFNPPSLSTGTNPASSRFLHLLHYLHFKFQITYPEPSSSMRLNQSEILHIQTFHFIVPHKLLPNLQALLIYNSLSFTNYYSVLTLQYV
jgi:hypothetical protein